MMQLLVDDRLKSEIQKNVERYDKVIHTIKMVENLALCVATVGSMVFTIYNILKPDAFVGYIRDEFRKDYFLIAMLASIILGMFLTLWILVRTLRKILANLNIGERVDEAIEIIDNFLFYTFRIKNQSLPTDRNVVIIDLNAVKDVKYDEKTKRITLTGSLLEKHIKVSEKLSNIKLSNMENRKLIVYDYFSPGLVRAFNSDTSLIHNMM